MKGWEATMKLAGARGACIFCVIYLILFISWIADDSEDGNRSWEFVLGFAFLSLLFAVPTFSISWYFHEKDEMELIKERRREEHEAIQARRDRAHGSRARGLNGPDCY